MQAWHDFAPRHEANPTDSEPAASPARFFPDAGLFVDRSRPAAHTVVNVRKGGLIKSTGQQGCWLSDTGPMLAFDDGRVLVTHLMQPAPIAGRAAGELAGSGRYRLNDGNLPDAPQAASEGRIPAPMDGPDGGAWCDPAKGELLSRGRFCRRKHHLANPWTQIAFRLMTLTIGRWNANLVRSTLQRILITGRKPEAWTFERHIRFDGETLTMVDVIEATSNDVTPLKRVLIGSDSTAIYVANSNTFQASTLRPPLDVPEACRLLNASTTGGRRAVRITRRYDVGNPAVRELTVEAV
jgi:hypothetical protein